MNFEEIGLKEPIVQAVTEMGFEQLTPIQEKTIPFIISGQGDLIALAQTGTGKTAAFGLPVLNMIDTEVRDTQVLVLCPTRELCLQITNELKNFSSKMKGLDVVAVYGGSSIEVQIKQLRKRCQIVVATPGRAIDLMERKALKIDSIQWLILDEADEMLSMGFKDDLDTLLAETPETKTTLLFSATMPADIERMAKNYMKNPQEIAVATKNIAAENVEHQYFLVRSKDRYEALKRIADVNPDIYAIVFCRTRMECKEVADKLIADGYDADALHGDLSQAQRDNVMQRFRNKHLQILVATDVAARGLDVNDLSHVINYNLPDDPEVYIHRSGRTGRAGKSGVSISLIHMKEKGKMRDIEKLCKKQFIRKQVPNGREICEIQLFNLIDKMRNVEIDEDQIGVFQSQIAEKLADMSRDELIKKFVSMEFNRFLDYYRNAADINVDSDEERGKKRGERRDRNGRERGKKYSRLFITLGSRDNVQPAKMMGFINRVVDNREVSIGKIDIMRNFSFFEVDQEHEQEVINAMQNAEFDGITVTVEPASSKGEQPSERKSSRSERRGGRGDRNDRGERGDRRDRSERRGRRDDFSSRRERRGGDFFIENFGSRRERGGRSKRR
ncbi:MAG: DEAD/DEAH box helicase [Bacteroidales bacterium]|jgi:ATP-dependent RNA helicase DeaD|nr:DEAD/DEAH box helicase [Bacteroidales bacterium]